VTLDIPEFGMGSLLVCPRGKVGVPKAFGIKIL